MHFLNEHMWSHPPVKGEGSAALRSWEIWLSVWFVTISWTLHITTTLHHCAANHAVNWKNPTDLTRCDPHEYYQVNCCCSVSHRIACYAWVVAMCNGQHIVTNHTESQISQEWRAALPSPFIGGWLHMCSFKKCITHSLSTLFSSTSVHFFFAHLLALSHM